jgi:hypothetical protein
MYSSSCPFSTRRAGMALTMALCWFSCRHREFPDAQQATPSAQHQPRHRQKVRMGQHEEQKEGGLGCQAFGFLICEMGQSPLPGPASRDILIIAATVTPTE